MALFLAKNSLHLLHYDNFSKNGVFSYKNCEIAIMVHYAEIFKKLFLEQKASSDHADPCGPEQVEGG